MKTMSKKEWKEMKKKASILKAASEAVRVEDKDILRTIDRFLREIGEMKSRISSQPKVTASSRSNSES